MKHRLRVNSELCPPDMQPGIWRSVRPCRWLRGCRDGISGPECPACGDGSENTQHRDDDNGQSPSPTSTSAPQIHSIPTIQHRRLLSRPPKPVKSIPEFGENPERFGQRNRYLPHGFSRRLSTAPVKT